MTPFWRRWLRRGEWDEELESHLAMRSEWNQRQLGLTAEQSSELASRQFGGKLQIRESIEDLYPARLLEDFAQDLRHAVRRYASAPGFALMVIATIAAGVAAATTIFSIVDPLLFRSLPFWNDHQLVSVGVYGPIDTNEFSMSGMYTEWSDHQTVFASLTAMRPGTQCNLQIGQAERVPCATVQQNFLPTLGVTPVIGRNFTSREDLPNAPRTMLISNRIWKSYFGSQPTVLGSVATLDDGPVRIVGVLPSEFVLPQGEDVDILLPAQLDDRLMRDATSTIFLRAFARLKPNITVQQAEQRMAPLFQSSIRKNVPIEVRRDIRPVIRSLRDRIIHEAELASHMLLGAVGLLLLMACLTVANLLLARAHAGRGELAMRSALGASRNRLVRQSLTETLVLFVSGGAIGFLLSWACTRLLVHAAPGGFLQLEKVHADQRALIFSGAVTLLATLLSGALPAWRRPDDFGVRSWRVTSVGTVRLRQALTSLQLACSLILLVGALLFARSLGRLESQQPGFSQDHLTAVSLRLSSIRYRTPNRIVAFNNQLQASLKALPGVNAIALSDSMPPAGSVLGRPLSTFKLPNGHTLSDSSGMVALRYITPEYFYTLGIPLLLGRNYTDAERSEPENTIVISNALAQRLFPAANPIGQRISLDGGSNWVTVIGVVGDVKNNGITAAVWPEYYRLRRTGGDRLGLTTVAFIRSQLDTATLARWVQKSVAALDPTVTVAWESMPARLHRLNDRPRFLTFVLLIFAVVSVLLAGSGLYGVIAFLVSSRAREMGVRSALGATRLDLLLLVQRQTLWCAGIGTVVGLTGSLALAGLVRGLLFQISPRDPRILVLAAVFLCTIAFLAAWAPAWKAAQTDPARALRVD